MPAASIAVILDRSSSMMMPVGGTTLFDLAKTDASTFINSAMQVNDNLAVIAFETAATMVYPSTQALQAVTGQSIKDAATGAINAMALGALTNMGDAIKMADAMLASAAAPMGAVLLSDGDANDGPLPPSSVTSSAIRLYTIALGPISDAGQATLQGLANMTGGIYNYVPNGQKLVKIYYSIISQTNIAAVAVNKRQEMGTYTLNQIPATVAGGTSIGTFALAWEDRDCQFINGTPTGNQVNVSLVDPSGNTYDTPAGIGPGFCVFQVPSPAAGQWTLWTWTANTNAFESQAGAFERDSAVQLAVKATRDGIAAGTELEVAASVTDEGEPVTGVAVSMKLSSPSTTLEQALALHADRLAAVPQQGNSNDPPAGETEALLRRARALAAADPSFTLLPYRERPVAFTEDDKGTYVLRGKHAEISGSHTVDVTVSGYAPRTRTPFTRTGQVSILAK